MMIRIFAGATAVLLLLLGIQTVRLNHAHDWMEAAKRAGEAQEVLAKQIGTRNKLTRLESERAYNNRIADLGASHTAAIKRLRKSADSRIVPAAPASAGEPVQVAVCFNEEQLDQRLRESVGRFLGRLEEIVRRGAVAEVSADSWRGWGVQTGVCMAPETVPPPSASVPPG